MRFTFLALLFIYYHIISGLANFKNLGYTPLEGGVFMIKLEKKDTQSMEDILKKSKKLPRIGDLLEGQVICAKPNEMILDISGLGTGQILGPELWGKAGKQLKIGDKVQACLIDLENEQGYMELSLREALEEKAWEDLGKLLNSGEATETNVAGLVAQLA